MTQNIITQMNVKLGGELWCLPIPVKRIMVIAMNFDHKYNEYGVCVKSILGVVSSLNNNQTEWYSRIYPTDSEETIKQGFTNAILKYYDKNNMYPDKIIIYRNDNCPRKWLLNMRDVDLLRSCLPNDYDPKLAIISVQTHLKGYIYSEKKKLKTGSKVQSCASNVSFNGYMPDSFEYDFFLASQLVSECTIMPTYYVVVYDNTQFHPEFLKRLSYQLAHLYYNWAGLIKVPAPCQVCKIL
jgi:aubergine-like protein